MADLPHNLPAILRNAGLTVIEHGGWQTRGRPASTGGFAPVGVLCHHTATGRSTSDTAVIQLLTHGRSDLPGPLCQLGLDRQGRVHVIAAGRANHAGRAKTSGTVAAGDGNRLYIGIEAFNDGRGEPWPQVQYDAYVTLAATLCRDVTGNSSATVRAHKETSTTGKIDPTFDMGAFRRRVDAAIRNPHIRTQPEEDMPLTDDDLNRIADRVWNRDAAVPNVGPNKGKNPNVLPKIALSQTREWARLGSINNADELAAKVAAKVGSGASAKDIAAELIRQLDNE